MNKEVIKEYRNSLIEYIKTMWPDDSYTITQHIMKNPVVSFLKNKNFIKDISNSTDQTYEKKKMEFIMNRFRYLAKNDSDKFNNLVDESVYVLSGIKPPEDMSFYDKVKIYIKRIFYKISTTAGDNSIFIGVGFMCLGALYTLLNIQAPISLLSRLFKEIVEGLKKVLSGNVSLTAEGVWQIFISPYQAINEVLQYNETLFTSFTAGVIFIMVGYGITNMTLKYGENI